MYKLYQVFLLIPQKDLYGKAFLKHLKVAVLYTSAFKYDLAKLNCYRAFLVFELVSLNVKSSDLAYVPSQ